MQEFEGIKHLLKVAFCMSILLLQIVVEAAGGEVLQWPSLEPLQYRKENILNPFFIVYGQRV